MKSHTLFAFSVVLLSLFAVVGRARDSVPSTSTHDSAARVESRTALVIIGHSEFSLESKRFSSIGDLRAELDRRVEANPHFAVLISGGGQANFGVMVQVLDECRKAGITDIKVAGAPAEKNAPLSHSEHP